MPNLKFVASTVPEMLYYGRDDTHTRGTGIRLTLIHTAASTQATQLDSSRASPFKACSNQWNAW